MYKVLLVDDERIIREGIASMINWKDLDLNLIGTAADGRAAADMIEKEPPDIVITDVKMPVLDGLELIAIEHELHPDMAFIVLSGYGEFELASGAMRYGVKHYLLKPCNEHAIIDALREVIDSLRRRDRREDLNRESRKYLEKMLPLLREQFLRDHLVSGFYDEEEAEYYCRLFNLESARYRVMILRADHAAQFEEMYALRDIVQKVFSSAAICLNSIAVNRLLILLCHMDEESIQDNLSDIKSKYSDLYGREFIASYSEEVDFRALPQAYREAERCLKFSFYLGEGSVITKKDIGPGNGEAFVGYAAYDYEKIADTIRSGNLDAVRDEIDSFFHRLKSAAYDIDVAKTYCMELFLTVVRQGRSDSISELNTDMMTRIQQTDCVDSIHDAIRDLSLKITGANYENIRNKQSKLVSSMIKCIHDNIENEDLSLKWIATHVVYMNVGYLGRLFCKETGEKFSHYVLNVRMEKAKELIDSCEDEKIYEVAKKIGFGDNPQYFSQLFKKYSGCTPSEYKSLRSVAAKL